MNNKKIAKELVKIAKELTAVKKTIVKPIRGEYGSITVLKQMKKDGLIEELMEKFDMSFDKIISTLSLSGKRVKRGSEIIFIFKNDAGYFYELRYPTEWEQPDPLTKPSMIVPIIKRAKIATEETPQSEYKRQVAKILLSLSNINKDWKEIKKDYDKQRKDDPTSWKGVGRGSELGDLVVECERLEKAFKDFK